MLISWSTGGSVFFLGGGQMKGLEDVLVSFFGMPAPLAGAALA